MGRSGRGGSARRNLGRFIARGAGRGAGRTMVSNTFWSCRRFPWLPRRWWATPYSNRVLR